MIWTDCLLKSQFLLLLSSYVSVALTCFGAVVVILSSFWPYDINFLFVSHVFDSFMLHELITCHVPMVIIPRDNISKRKRNEKNDTQRCQRVQIVIWVLKPVIHFYYLSLTVRVIQWYARNHCFMLWFLSFLSFSPFFSFSLPPPSLPFSLFSFSVSLLTWFASIALWNA